MKQPVERRLAAILAADVAGYSRLMGEDEAGTAQALCDHRRHLSAVSPLHDRIVQAGGAPIPLARGVGEIEETSPCIPRDASDKRHYRRHC